MKISQIIRERRTVHSYLCEEVPTKVLMEALELASLAPNHKLTFPFLFVPVGPIAREKLAELAFDLKGQKEPIRTKFLKEGSLTFFAQKISKDEFTRKEDYASLSCAIQNFSLFMWEQGYGTKWSSGEIIRSPKTYGILSINPEEYEIVAMVWAGKFKSVPKAPLRPKIDELIRAVD